MMNTLWWQLSVLALITAKKCQGTTQFTTQPVNKTVNFGDIAEFECRVNVEVPNYSLILLIGEVNVEHGASFRSLDRREFFTNVTGNLGRLWISMNTRTIPLFDYFWCRVIYGSHQSLFSDKAYVDVKYPECNSESPSSQTDNALTLPSTLSPTKSYSTLQTYPYYALTSQLPKFQQCRCDTTNNEVVNNQTVLYYQAAFGACLIIVFLMSIFLIIIFIRIWVLHRIKNRERSTQNSTNRICNALVHNPIYDGPVYDSIQPQLVTLTPTTTRKAEAMRSPCSSSDQSQLLELDQDKVRYVIKPSPSRVPGQVESPSPYIHPLDHNYRSEELSSTPSASKDDCPLISSKSELKCEDRINSSSTTAKGLALAEKEDVYTLMNPAGTLAASLISGWGEVNQHVNKKDSIE